MTVDKATTKIFFGLLIFMFSVALAYFSASYLRAEDMFDYWSTLLLFTAAYIIVGIVVYHIFPVSLGFLFSSDVLILHLLLENFETIPTIGKTIIIGAVLVVLYLFAWLKMQDSGPSSPPIPPAPSDKIVL
ncbi:MAG: hypothetical protein HY395_01580 [Candidatus Doudnabacteria bacterium]|nr:hypothetical protein [Candidatus Doudnabacteria bacterium]